MEDLLEEIKLLLNDYHEKQSKEIQDIIHQELDEFRSEILQYLGKKNKDFLQNQNIEIQRKELDSTELREWLRDGIGNQDIQKILEKYYGPRKKWNENSKKIVQWTQKDCILLLKTFDREEYHSKYNKIAELEKLMKREKKTNANSSNLA